MIAVGYGDPYRHVLGFVSCLADTAGECGEYSGSSRRHYATNIAGRRLPVPALKRLGAVVAVSDSSALATR
jgi:hypothetical protein